MRRVLGRLAAALAVLAALGFLATLFLFTGSPVECDEGGTPAEPWLRCELEIAAPREAVWRAFTVTGVPRPHYFDAVLEAETRVGGRWRFVTEDRRRLLAGGEILALEPPGRFVQSFAAADLDEPPSRISVELEPTTGGTRVRLVHDRFAGRTRTFRRFRRAHPLALSALESLLERGRLPLRARLYTAIFKPGMNLVTARAEPWE